jgi:hypothetical protein
MKHYHIRFFSPVWWLGCGAVGFVAFYGAIFIALVAQAAMGG